MNIAIYGTGGGGKETLQIVQDIMKKEKRWKEIIFIDDTKNVSKFHGYKCFPYNVFKKKYHLSDIEIHVALGEIGLREELIKKVEKDGFKLATIIHPNSIIGKNVYISEGVQIKMGVILENNIHIGKGCWIQAYAHIRDNVSISNFCQVSAKTLIKENVFIENNVFIGMHAIIEKNLTIKTNAIVSMGAVARKNILSEQVVMGNPARLISLNNNHKVF